MFQRCGRICRWMKIMMTTADGRWLVITGYILTKVGRRRKLAKLPVGNENVSSSHHFFDGVSWHRVKEKDQKGRQKQDHEDLDNHPLVVMPENVANWLEGIQKPYKWWIWSTERTNRFLNHIKGKICTNYLLIKRKQCNFLSIEFHWK